MSNAQHTEAVITTAGFRAGQAAAHDGAGKGCTPNFDLLARVGDEFAAGFRYEWREYIAPLLGTVYAPKVAA